ncbi:MAG TPA: hypothetical protein DHV28_17485 [Ignavibacteriales bacterium]|nr:hypothetical protein [Ignavibacteriales bacterium]
MILVNLKKKYKVLIIIFVIVIVIRLILPYIVLYYANNTLANMKSYYGHINDIDISIYRGAYTINNIYLNKIDSVSKKQTEFFKSKQIDLSIEWKALIKGSLVGEMVFETPEIIFTKDKAEIGDIKKDTTDFRYLLNHFMPLKVNRFEINNGTIHYVDNTSKTKVDIFLKQAHILVQNLTNVIDDEVELPSTVSAQASVYQGTLNFNMKLDALAENATFDINAELKNTNLVLLNDFMKAYGNFDVNQGTFGLYTEMAAKDGKFKGYVKPIIKDLDVVGIEDENDNVFQNIWEFVVGGVAAIFTNQEKDQVASKVRIEGVFNNPQTNTLDAVWELLRNAFIQALIPSIDYEININTVKTDNPDDKPNTLQKIFSAGKNKERK